MLIGVCCYKVKNSRIVGQYGCFKKSCINFLGLLLVNLHQAKGGAGDELAVEGDVYGVVTGLLELETLEVHDKVAGEERYTLGQSHLEVTDDGHTLGVESNTVLIDNGDTELVVTLVLGHHAKTQSQRTGGVYNGELTGKESIKGTLNAELALIIGGVVAKYGNLNIHNMMCKLDVERKLRR